MKSSYLKVGDECSGRQNGLYDTEMRRGSVLVSRSLFMKGETLGPATRWHSIPTIQIGQS